MLRIKERGVPNGARGKRGDIYVSVLIKIPQNLSRKEKELIEELKKEGI
jgi:molecular chaperone DnaJ